MCRDPAPPTGPTPAPAAPKPQVVHSDLIGATAGELIQLMGQPALQVRLQAGAFVRGGFGGRGGLAEQGAGPRILERPLE